MLADGQRQVDGESADAGQLTGTADQHQSSQVVGPGRPLVACVFDVTGESRRRKRTCTRTVLWSRDRHQTAEVRSWSWSRF